MKLITFTLMLSLLALAALRPADAVDPSWHNFVRCTRVGTRVVSAVLRESVPAFRTYLTCIDFTPPPNPHKNFLGYVKVLFEFLKRSIYEKSECLLTPLRRSVILLKPHIDQIDNLECFDR